jgi:hypothetical protein
MFKSKNCSNFEKCSKPKIVQTWKNVDLKSKNYSNLKIYILKWFKFGNCSNPKIVRIPKNIQNQKLFKPKKIKFQKTQKKWTDKPKKLVKNPETQTRKKLPKTKNKVVTY